MFLKSVEVSVVTNQIILMVVLMIVVLAIVLTIFLISVVLTIDLTIALMVSLIVVRKTQVMDARVRHSRMTVARHLPSNKRTAIIFDVRVMKVP